MIELTLEEVQKIVNVLGKYPAGEVYETLRMLENKTVEALKPKTNEPTPGT